MLVETADASAVAMRISRAEWTALREADIRTAVDSALETHGLAPWTSMKIELFVAEKEVLLIARPISDPPRRFRFRSFADLTAALGCFPAGLDSDVVYIDGSWELFVRAEDERCRTRSSSSASHCRAPRNCTHISANTATWSPAAMPLGPFSAISADFALFIFRRMC